MAFLGFKLDIDDDAEVVDMCNEFRRFERKCREEGKREALVEYVKRLVKKGLSILEICDFTGASDETVREIILSLES